MDLTINHSPQNCIVHITGQFTFADAQKFKEVIELASNKQTKNIQIEFAGVTFIDSAGMGMLLLLRDECKTNEVSISLNSPKGQVEKIFTISKFDQLFTIRS